MGSGFAAPLGAYARLPGGAPRCARTPRN